MQELIENNQCTKSITINFPREHQSGMLTFVQAVLTLSLTLSAMFNDKF